MHTYAHSIHGHDVLALVLDVGAQVRQVGADRVADHQQVAIHLRARLAQVVKLRALEGALVPQPDGLVGALGAHHRVLLFVREHPLHRFAAAGGQRVYDREDALLHLGRDADVPTRRERRRERVHPRLQPHAHAVARAQLLPHLGDEAGVERCRVRRLRLQLHLERLDRLDAVHHVAVDHLVRGHADAALLLLEELLQRVDLDVRALVVGEAVDAAAALAPTGRAHRAA
mmetsp:Transcript_56711/g.155910  ORF Transcript_56711/g.155910 Transcript_56711/m.155910 type:complete len:229 (+) Transcript_56711:226-912(+)